MKTQLQLTIFIVYFGSVFVHPYDRNRYQSWKKALQTGVLESQNIFNNMKDELKRAQNTNIHRKNSFSDEKWVKKRETNNPGATVSSTEDGWELEYEYYTVEYAKEVPNITMMREPCEYLCRYSDEKRIKICKEALQHEFAIKHGIKFVEGGKLGEAKMYAFQVTSGPYQVYSDLIISACTCPTSPTIYLGNKFQGYDVHAYMVLPGVGEPYRKTDKPEPADIKDFIDDSLFS